MMSINEVYQRAVRGLAAQGWRQSLVDGHCAYRGECGLKCAVGHGIDDTTAENWDSILIDVGSLPRAARAAAGLPDNLDFLQRMQGAHDSADGPNDMRRRMRAMLDDYPELEWPDDVARPSEV